MKKEKIRDEKKRQLEDSGALNTKHDDVRDLQFKDNDFFDPRDILQVKYEMLRRVQKDNWPVTQAAAEYGFSRFALYDAEANFKKRGLLGLLPKKKGPRRSHKLTDDILAFIARQTEENKNSPAELADLIYEQFNLVVHPRSIGRAIARWKKKDGNEQ